MGNAIEVARGAVDVGTVKTHLRLYVPALGTLSFVLCDESSALYGFLTEVGETARFKRLDHLGALRLAWEGAHHSRWEYVTAILALIDRCAESSSLHLRSTVKLPSNTRASSGAELLKSWTLLLNVGHLSWTFAAERALLLELYEQPALRQELVSIFDDNRLREWASSILERGAIYKFHQVLAFPLLQTGNAGLRWEWEKRGDAPVALVGTRRTARRFIHRLPRRQKLRKSQQAEFAVLKTLLRYRPTRIVVVSLGRLVAYSSQDRTQQLELDGCIVEPFDDGTLTVTFVEVNTGVKSGLGSAKRQLRRQLEILAPGLRPPDIGERSGQGWRAAYATVTLPVAIEPHTDG